MSAADLIAQSIEIGAESDWQSGPCRPYSELCDVLRSELVPSEAAGVREVLRMLRDSAQGAADVHDGTDDELLQIDVARLRRFCAAIEAAMIEVAT